MYVLIIVLFLDWIPAYSVHSLESFETKRDCQERKQMLSPTLGEESTLVCLLIDHETDESSFGKETHSES
jgi:hypothetical protein